ncbi:serine palmitoyltransferase [Nematocida minor]|uniref:serine palmitoyltransferase n=1 Tax=Nematocida minor TaxID=1912983 RepID=UPI0022204E4B|nr:serine palmitoyltransferase [Nematocida minor]KAI5191086.1 serine palmitoyltransferase [Nematocida minor]
MSDIYIPFFTIVTTYFSYFIVIVLGHARDFVGQMIFPKLYKHMFASDGRPPLFTASGSFYTRRLYGRLSDCWNRPITGIPGRNVKVLIRARNKDGDMSLTGESKVCLNLASYNYLGYAGKYNNEAKKALHKHPIAYCGPVKFLPPCPLVKKLEKEISGFLYKEDAIVFPMGFATNACSIPYLVSKGDLIIADSLNHSSIFFGTRISPCKVERFAHNDIPMLEKILRKAIIEGQDRTHRPIGRILVIVEGIYSMEGECVKLNEIIELKKKYPFYLFIDEAHSIGAMGKTGRGVCEYLGVDFKDIDLLMGTFTKSFGASGGYIAANKKIINLLRKRSELINRGEQMPPVVATQILECLKRMQTEEGIAEIQKLSAKSRYFRSALLKMRFIVIGEKDSPVVSLMLYNPGKIAEFSRMCLKENIAVVVVGYPATPVISSRVRFCLSVAHTKEDLDRALSVIDKIGDLLGLKMAKKEHILQQ